MSDDAAMHAGSLAHRIASLGLSGSIQVMPENERPARVEPPHILTLGPHGVTLECPHQPPTVDMPCALWEPCGCQDDNDETCSNPTNPTGLHQEAPELDGQWCRPIAACFAQGHDDLQEVVWKMGLTPGRYPVQPSWDGEMQLTITTWLGADTPEPFIQSTGQVWPWDETMQCYRHDSTTHTCLATSGDLQSEQDPDPGPARNVLEWAWQHAGVTNRDDRTVLLCLAHLTDDAQDTAVDLRDVRNHIHQATSRWMTTTDLCGAMGRLEKRGLLSLRWVNPDQPDLPDLPFIYNFPAYQEWLVSGEVPT